MLRFTGHGRDADAKSWETPFASTKLASSQQSLSGEGVKGVRMRPPGEPCTILVEANRYSFSGEEVWKILIKLKMLLSTV